MRKEVIIACDFDTAQELARFLDQFDDQKPYVKIGPALFYSEGPDVVRLAKAKGHQVFLDVKLHDLPKATWRAMRAVGALGVDMTNVHAAGGSEMMQAALEGLAEGGYSRPVLMADTLLTSISQKVLRGELLVPGALEEVVAAYATTAQAAGLDGVVCGPQEVPAVKEWCGPEFFTLTPGIRFAGEDLSGQRRVATPAQAARLGSDYIVVGRSVTHAADPAAAYLRVAAEFAAGA